MTVTTDETRRIVPPPYPTGLDVSAHIHHGEYYLEDGNLVILIKDILFKIWDGSFRRHSEFFQCPPASLLKDKSIEGTDDEHPLVLTDLEVVDFERLLWIVYPQVIGTFKAKTSQDWIAVLDLATRWKFKDIRDLSVKELAKFELDPLEKIELQQRYDIRPQWAWSAFNALCSRTNGLNVAEGKRLGVETIIKISAVREKLEKWGRKKPEEVRKAVAEIFELELEGPPITGTPPPK